MLFTIESAGLKHEVEASSLKSALAKIWGGDSDTPIAKVVCIRDNGTKGRVRKFLWYENALKMARS